MSSGALLRLGIGMIVAGVALLCWAIVPTLGFAQSVPACNNQGLPNPCFFTPPKDTGNPLAPLQTLEPIPQDPQLAHTHAWYARQLAPRLAIVREAAGVTAYAVGDYAAALAELRNSILVAADRDFQKLGRRIRVLWLLRS